MIAGSKVQGKLVEAKNRTGSFDWYLLVLIPSRWIKNSALALFGAEYLDFGSSCSLNTREKYTNWDNLVCLSLHSLWGQSNLCLLLQKKVFCKSKHRWLCAQKIYKLRRTKLSQFVYFSLVWREREETKTKYSAP